MAETKARRSVSNNFIQSNTFSLKPAGQNTLCSGSCSEPYTAKSNEYTNGLAQVRFWGVW